METNCTIFLDNDGANNSGSDNYFTKRQILLHDSRLKYILSGLLEKVFFETLK